MAMGSNNYVARNSCIDCYSNSGSGTSWSCPMLAGAAALLLEVDPSLTPMQLATILKSTASNSNSPNNLYGWGIIDAYDAVQSLITSTGNQNNIPEDFIILQSYPNPFNPSTKVRFSVPERSDVRLTLHDILGREIAVLFNDVMNAGTREIELDGSNLASGVYLVRMNAANYQKTLKISLLK
jgi:hypothetical protein